MASLKFMNVEGAWETIDTFGAIKYIQQNLTDAQQAQARENLGISAISSEQIDSLF